MSEIKLDVAQLEQKLIFLNETIANLHIDVQESPSGQSIMNFSEKINEINQNMKQIFQTYQQLAEQHVKSTKLVVESLEEAEKFSAQNFNV
ncbi:YwqI/YxiC family protein [Oceanobacillus sp. 1P07AA]|uniref:YwqI/YxiC family protein n=1 Tax=Oceanobacillus sp. 1P07AA TaxID=3132293 RepID=UPI0039A4E8C4